MPQFMLIPKYMHFFKFGSVVFEIYAFFGRITAPQPPPLPPPSFQLPFYKFFLVLIVKFFHSRTILEL